MTAIVLGLLLKIAMTAGIVVAASVVVERSGPFVGSLIASLPTAGGAALIILAMEHPPAFVAQSAVGSMVANALVAFFSLTYAALAQRRSVAVSVGVAFAVWFGFAALSRLIDWTANGAIVLNVVVYTAAILIARRFIVEAPVKARVQFTWTDLAWRAGVVTVCVLAVTAASHSIGSYFSGLFVFFPVAMGSYFIILHPRIGGKATATVAAYAQAPLVGLGFSMLAVHLLAEPLGVWWSYAIGLSIGLGWNALLWGLRNWRMRAA